MSRTHHLQIAEFMSKRPVNVILGTTVADAAQTLSTFRIGSLVVVDKNKKLVGIFTTRDIVYDVIAKNKDPKKVLVDDIMVSNIITISPEKNIQDAMELMSANDIRQLPVTVGETLVGFVTMKDVLRVEPALVDLAVESFRAEEEERQEFVEKFSSPEHELDDFIKRK
jgi:CBS domain-containing protein